MTKSPGTNSPVSSTKKQRSASPSYATPRSACSSSVLPTMNSRFSGSSGFGSWFGKRSVRLEVARHRVDRQPLEHGRQHRAGHPVRRVDHDPQRPIAETSTNESTLLDELGPDVLRFAPRRASPGGPNGFSARSRTSSSPDSPPTGSAPRAHDLHPGVLLRVVRGGDADRRRRARARRRRSRASPSRPSRGRARRRRRRRRRRSAPRTSTGEERRMSRPTAIRAARTARRRRGRSRTRLPRRARRIDAADVVGLEDLGIEHALTLAEARRAPRSTAVPRNYNYGVERKLATVLFVDLVGSTEFVAARDPEVVRRRVNSYFEHVSHCIATHGGIVEKFAGDAVMAAFGDPAGARGRRRARRPRRAAILDAVHELGLEARIGVEAAKSSSTSRTRRSQPARPSMSPRGSSRSPSRRDPDRPVVRRLTRGRSWNRGRGSLELKGFDEPLPPGAARRSPTTTARARGAAPLRRPRASSSSCSTTRSLAWSATVARTSSRSTASRASARAASPASSSTASKARRVLCGPLPALRRGRHLLAARRDGQGRGGDRATTTRSQRSVRQAARVLR